MGLGFSVSGSGFRVWGWGVWGVWGFEGFGDSEVVIRALCRRQALHYHSITLISLSQPCGGGGGGGVQICVHVL